MVKTLRYAFMAMLMLVCSTAFAGVITLNATNFKSGETATVTQDGITLSIDKGTSTSVPATCIMVSSSVSTRVTY